MERQASNVTIVTRASGGVVSPGRTRTPAGEKPDGFGDALAQASGGTFEARNINGANLVVDGGQDNSAY